jgi:hypothetical protein
MPTGTVEPNLAEVTRDEMIRAEVAKLKAKDDAQLIAEAEKIVEAELAEAAEVKRLAEEAAAAEIARAEAVKARGKIMKVYTGLVAKWMIDNDCDNPASIPASVVDDLRKQGGI